MDKYITITKPFYPGHTAKDNKKRVNVKTERTSSEEKLECLKGDNPTELCDPITFSFSTQSSVTSVSVSLPKRSSTAITKHLLKTLPDESNPITHSDIGLRADHVTSISTGHQVADDGGRKRGYFAHRNQKLRDQTEESKSKLLENVRIYINGYLSNTTDIEMKRMVTLAGGRVMATASGATHILTSQQLSGSKTHKILAAKSRHQVHVVKPEWVTDSIDAGRRRSEREYSVIKLASNRSLRDMLQS